MKLGFRLIEVDTGDQVRLKIGEGEWTKKTNITNFQSALLADDISIRDTQSFLLSFRFIPEGLLLALTRRLEGDRGSERSNETLWIFVDKQIALTSHEINEILKGGREVMHNFQALRGSETDFINHAPEALTRDYPVVNYPAHTGDMRGTLFATIDCEAAMVPGIIARGYQRDYANYSYISFNTSGKRNPDIPSIPLSSLKERVWVSIPVWPANLQSPDPVEVRVDNIKITGPGAHIVAGLHNITLSRNGYAALTFRAEVKPGQHHFDFSQSHLDRLQWYRQIETRNFQFLREDNTPITSGIRLSSPDTFDQSGKPLTLFKYSDLIYVPENRLRNLRLDISGDTVKTMQTTIDLTRPVVIRVMSKMIGASADANIDGNRVQVNITGPYARELERTGIYMQGGMVRKMPPGGFINMTGGRGDGNYGKSKSNKLSGILACVSGIFFATTILFLILWLTKPGKSDNTAQIQNIEQTDNANQAWNNRTQTAGNNPVNNMATGDNTEGGAGEDTAPDLNYSLEKAIEYLDLNPIGTNVLWEKIEMEKYPDLKGLFDDLNEFQLEKIVNEWGPKLKESKNFSKLVEAAKKNIKNKWNPSQGSHVPYYNKEGDFTINATMYTYWIDQDQTPKEKKKKSEPSTPKKSKESTSKTQNTTTDKNNNTDNTKFN